MPKRLIYMAVALLAMAMTMSSCQDDDEWRRNKTEDVPEGYVKLEFGVNVPALTEVNTRAVDPDGGGIQNMTLFCFDKYGLFITTTTTTTTTTIIPDTPVPNNPGSYTSGTIKSAVVPQSTRVIHFVANQNMTDFKDIDFHNHTESEVMAKLEGSSTRMIYWARFACDKNNEASIDEQLKTHNVENGNPNIKMIRNHARISIKDPQGNSQEENGNKYFKVSEFYIVNTNQFGTVAPYHPEEGFDIIYPNFKSDGKTELNPKNFVTLPERTEKISNPMDMRLVVDNYAGQITSNPGMYVFETENAAEDPVSIIIKGKNTSGSEELYYRVMIVNEKGEQIMIRRNHNYILNINGELQYGQKSLDNALDAPATNNVWIAISDEVNEVQDDKFILTVPGAYVLEESKTTASDKTFDFDVTLKSAATQGDVTEDDLKGVEFYWMPDNNVAEGVIRAVPSVSNGKGNKIDVQITLLPMSADNQIQTGTIVVKKGLLMRKVKITTIKQQKFTPAWVTNHVDAEVSTQKNDKEELIPGYRPQVTLMFTIPETTPEELFPMNVYIDTEDLDIRNSSGVKLDVVYKGMDNYYGSDHYGTGYKYVLVVEKPGVQRVYFESIVDHTNPDKPEDQTYEVKKQLTIEAPYFEPLSRTYMFTANDQTWISLQGANVNSFNTGSSGTTEGYANDQDIQYILVPRKKFAHIEFDMKLNVENSTITGSTNDEFMLYTQKLKSYAHVDRDATVPHLETQVAEDPTALPLPGQPYTGSNDVNLLFYPFQSEDWMNKFNPDGGRMLMFKPKAGSDTYTVHLYTENPVSDQVVRLASNRHDQESVLSPGNKYTGNVFRSATFELATYNPFRFGASVIKPDDLPDGQIHIDKDGLPTSVVYDNEWYDPFENQISTAIMGGKSNNSDQPELLTEMNWSYQPEQPVQIEFDVTSFGSKIDGKVTDVDPFGAEFEIYIDAPMLEIADGENNVEEDPNVPGRFIYMVKATREEERIRGSKAAKRTIPGDYLASDVNQTDERKSISFRTKSIVSAGDIVISSNKDKVDFFTKTFTVKNKPITGYIAYQPDGKTATPIPTTGFVSFELTRNNNRIGTVTLSKDGDNTKYELKLRKEYAYNWRNDPIRFTYTAIVDNKVVSFVFDKYLDSEDKEQNLDLEHLFSISKKEETIILKPNVSTE